MIRMIEQLFNSDWLGFEETVPKDQQFREEESRYADKKEELESKLTEEELEIFHRFIDLQSHLELF